MGTRGNKLGTHGRERALVVEADRHKADSAVEVLRDMGYAVHVARDSREALATLSRAPKLVLVNASPPGGGVADFVKRLRKLRGLEDVPVVATHEEPPSKTVQLLLMDAGVGAFMAQPFAPADVAGALSEASGQGALPEFQPVTPVQRRARRTSPLPSFAPPSEPSLEAIPLESISTTSMSAVGEVAARLLHSGGEIDCRLTGAARGVVELRVDASHAPGIGEQVRLMVGFRDAVADAMRDMPVRILGKVKSFDFIGASALLEVDIDVASPETNMDQLNRYFLRF